ncbi:MAG: TIGR04219 family outer membrane beta-barrel protein, partial [Thiohalomonadales bacterium]|nr:TIGR04219 family outer membrane beta-barrel protein [Thiohalomonadales bacterium]
MKKLSTLACAAILSVPSLSLADTLSVSIGGGMWQEDPSGYFRNGSLGDTTNVDVNDDLFWTEENQGYLFVTFEHPVPLVPNFRVMNTSLDHSGSGTASFVLNGKTFSGNVTSSGSFDQTDITAYWEVLDNVVSLDLGLNVKLLDFSYSVSSTTVGQTPTSDSLSATIPMLYGLVGASPIPGLFLGVEGNWIGYDGNNLTDFTAKVSYTTDFLLGIEGGYRSQTYELDDVDGYFGKLEFKGPFIGA